MEGDFPRLFRTFLYTMMIRKDLECETNQRPTLFYTINTIQNIENGNSTTEK